MKQMRHFAVFILLLAFYSSSLFAQEETYTIGQGQAAIDFLLTFPQGEFKEQSDNVGVGLGLDFSYVFPRLPLSAGLTGSFATYGSRTFKVQFAPLVTVDLTTTNNIATGHLFLRLQPQEGMFRPFVEGLVGMHYFWTESELKDERYEDRDFAGSTNLSDAAFSYGAGGGIQFSVYRGATNTPGQGIEVLIDLKARYLYGGKAKYYDERSVTFDANGAPVLDERNAIESTTDMLQTLIGVSFRF